MIVDPYASGLDLASCPVGAVDVGGPYRGRESVSGVVGECDRLVVIVEWETHQDGTEDLILNRRGVLFGFDDERWFVVATAGKLAAWPPVRIVLPEFIRPAQDLCDRAAPGSSAALKTMRLVAASAGQDPDATARIDDVDLGRATTAELNRIGPRWARRWPGLRASVVTCPDHLHSTADQPRRGPPGFRGGAGRSP